MLKYMDRGADPCEDFYQFACGNWARHNPIPKDKAAYDTFEMIRESLDSVLKELLEDPIPKRLELNTDDATVKAKYLFQSCMNYGELFFQFRVLWSEMSASWFIGQFFNTIHVARDLGATHGTTAHTASGRARWMAHIETRLGPREV